MRYTKFIISNYRAITGPLEIDVDRRSLTPIIGVNESGKTTILHAIFAFDHHNDNANDDGRHLRDTQNLYKTRPPDAQVQAHLNMSKRELISALSALEKADPAAREWAGQVKGRRKLPEQVIITRTIRTLAYHIDTSPLSHPTFGDALARQLVSRAPFILFFDDFRDKVDEKIEIAETRNQSISGWLAIIEQLFKRTDRKISVFQLAEMEERQRKSVLSKVERHLNETLTREWATFRLDDRDALQISMEFVTDGAAPSPQRHYLKLEVVETDANNDRHYFFISDRSKGFFWFFNFVMKLEFNPKVMDDDDTNTIYLLDEPGSYLHASAQSKLCRKLRGLSERNRVIYCTHSHYLLDPEVIPLSSIRVADKNANGNIHLVPIFEHKGNILERRSAFQPVIDALQIKPFILDLTAERAIIVEGICDYYAFELFKGGRRISIIPSVGAGSAKFYISLMLAWQVSFWVLWDNDEEGRRAFTEGRTLFGEEVARLHFRQLPSGNGQADCILQDLFHGGDLAMLRRELALPPNSSFDKVLAALYYSTRRSELVDQVSTATKERFEHVLESFALL